MMLLQGRGQQQLVARQLLAWGQRKCSQLLGAQRKRQLLARGQLVMLLQGRGQQLVARPGKAK